MAGSVRTLHQLQDEGAIERRDIGHAQLAKWLDRSERDLTLAKHARRIDDLERAATLVYEAGLRCCIALLAVHGYRLRSVEGHHRAALEAARAIGGRELEPTMSRLDDARRMRNESLYGSSRTIGDSEFTRLEADVQALLRMTTEAIRGQTRRR